MGESLVEHIPSKENIADLLTKTYIDIKEDTLSVISFMTYMMTTSYHH